MYKAYITTLKNVRPHPNADRMLLADCFGNTVCVGLEAKENDIIIYFPVDGELSKEYAEINGCHFNVENGPQCDNVDILTPAIDICREHGIEFEAYNKNPEWELMTQDYSRKIFADYFNKLIINFI